MSETLQGMLARDAFQAAVCTTSRASLEESVNRMCYVLIVACNKGAIESEHKVHKSISDQERWEIESSFQHFLQHQKAMSEMLKCGVPISMLENDFGGLYKRILEIAAPWRIIWGNVFNISMTNCAPHSIHGYPVKPGL